MNVGRLTMKSFCFCCFTTSQVAFSILLRLVALMQSLLLLLWRNGYRCFVVTWLVLSHFSQSEIFPGQVEVLWHNILGQLNIKCSIRVDYSRLNSSRIFLKGSVLSFSSHNLTFTSTELNKWQANTGWGKTRLWSHKQWRSDKAKQICPK